MTTTAVKKSSLDSVIHLDTFLSADRCAIDVDASSKKRAFEHLSEYLASALSSLDPREIFECLINRERLGTTALGKGIAIPHGRVAGIEQPVAAFLRLRESIDCDAVDRQPVDLMFALLVPEESNDQHLKILAHLARLFSDAALTSALRQTETNAQMYELLVNYGNETA